MLEYFASISLNQVWIKPGKYAYMSPEMVSYPECTENQVRLVDGRNELEGRVEICKEGLWGGVCDDIWNEVNSLVVCRELGISTTSKFHSDTHSHIILIFN